MEADPICDDPFVVFRQADGWYFRRGDGRMSVRHETEAAAGAAATTSKQSWETNRGARFLARVYLSERHVPLTVLRVGLAKLGPDGIEEFRHIASQATKVRTAWLANALGAVDESDLPVAYRRYVSLYREVVELDWPAALDELLSNCTDLVAALRGLFRGGASEERRHHGYAVWQWAASVLAVSDAGVGRQLDDALAAGTVPAPELADLASARTRCPLSSHVHLMAYVMREYFPPDIMSPTRVRTQLIDCFLNRADEVLDSAREEVRTCQTAVRSARTCANSKEAMTAGIPARAVAQTFLGFGALNLWWDEFVKLGAPPVKRGQRGHGHDKHTSDPKMIDYARDWSSRSPWDAIPLGAGVFPAQGQTRSPKGHRA